MRSATPFFWVMEKVAAAFVHSALMSAVEMLSRINKRRNEMSEETGTMTKGSSSAIALNVRLKPVEHTDQPVLANYTYAGTAQGVAYVDFGFIEPALLGAILQRAQKGESLPKSLEGSLATRVALPLDALIRLQQQLTQILIGLNWKPSVKS